MARWVAQVWTSLGGLLEDVLHYLLVAGRTARGAGVSLLLLGVLLRRCGLRSARLLIL